MWIYLFSPDITLHLPFQNFLVMDQSLIWRFVKNVVYMFLLTLYTVHQKKIKKISTINKRYLIIKWQLEFKILTFKLNLIVYKKYEWKQCYLFYMACIKSCYNFTSGNIFLWRLVRKTTCFYVQFKHDNRIRAKQFISLLWS